MYQAYNLPAHLEFTNTKFLDVISYCWFSTDTKWFTEYFKTTNYLIEFLFRNKDTIKNKIKILLETNNLNFYSKIGYEILIQISWKKEENDYIIDLCRNENKLIFRRENNQNASQSLSNL